MNTQLLKVNQYIGNLMGLRHIFKSLQASYNVEDEFEEVALYELNSNTVKHEIDFTKLNENSLSSKSASGNSMLEVPVLLRPKSLEENLEVLHQKLEDSKNLDLLIHELQEQAELFEYEISHLEKEDKIETLMLPKEWKTVLQKRVEEHSHDLAKAEHDCLIAQQRVSDTQASFNELSKEYAEIKYGLEQNAIFISQQEPLYMQTLADYERAQEIRVRSFVEDQCAEGEEECSISASYFSQDDEISVACERMSQAEAIILEATQVLIQLESSLQEVELRMGVAREEHELAQAWFDQKLAGYTEMQSLFNEVYHNYRDTENLAVDDCEDQGIFMNSTFSAESDLHLDKVNSDFVAA
jgi:hypothetical protein